MRSATCKQFSPRIRLASSWPPRPPHSQPLAGACAPRIVVYLFAVTIALWMLLALSLSLPVWKACALPGGQRCRERACSALRSRLRYAVLASASATATATASASASTAATTPPHEKTRALLALIRLGPGGVDAATATSPHRVACSVSCSAKKCALFLSCSSIYDVPQLPTVRLSVRPSPCPPICLSARPSVRF